MPGVAYLILVDICVFEFFLALALKGDDDQGHEDVHEEERKHDEVNHVEHGYLEPMARLRSAVDTRGIDGMLQYTERQSWFSARRCRSIELTLAILRPFAR